MTETEHLIRQAARELQAEITEVTTNEGCTVKIKRRNGLEGEVQIKKEASFQEILEVINAEHRRKDL